MRPALRQIPQANLMAECPPLPPVGDNCGDLMEKDEEAATMYVECQNKHNALVRELRLMLNPLE